MVHLEGDQDVTDLTLQQISTATGCGVVRAQTWLPWINKAMAEFEINTPARIAAFLSQVGHESGSLHFLEEIWGPSEAQVRYERNFKAPWPPTDADDTNSLAYRLGNEKPGDGRRFKGRGLLETTGRSNYARTRNRMRERFGPIVPDFESDPLQLSYPQWASMSAGDYWADHGLNVYADKGDIDGVSDLINRGRKTPRVGDSNGWADRLARYEYATKVLA